MTERTLEDLIRSRVASLPETRRGGYDPESVDLLLSDVLRAIEDERGRATPTSSISRRHVERMGEKMTDLLATAEQNASEIRAEAEKEAAAIVVEARRTAAEMARKTELAAEAQATETTEAARAKRAEADGYAHRTRSESRRLREEPTPRRRRGGRDPAARVRSRGTGALGLRAAKGGRDR